MTPDARRRLLWFALLGAPFVARGELTRLAVVDVASFALAATGLGIVSGMCGQISLGHAALMGAGAFTSAGLSVHAGWPPLAGIAAGTGLAAAVGFAVGVPSLRIRGQYLALATLGAGFIVFQVTRQAVSLTGGDFGLGGIPPVSAAGRPFTPLGTALLAAGLLAAALVVAGNIARARAGRAYRAVRENEFGAEASGVSVYRAKLSAFVLSALLAGAGGAVFAHANGFVAPLQFAPQASLLLVLAVVLGGMSSPYGGALGALLVLGPSELAPQWFSWLERYQLVAWGPVALLVVFRWPDGVIGGVRALAGRYRRRAPGGPVPARPEIAGLVRPGAEAGAAALEVRGVTKRYGGLVVLDAVDLTVRAGTIHALIGPNGSGKTTLVDCVNGFVRPDAGTIGVAGERVDGRPAHRIAALGVGRTFQTVAVFGGMTARENAMLGAQRLLGHGAIRGAAGLRDPREDEAARDAAALLVVVGLGGLEGRPGTALSYGQRKRLELARALACRPSLLLLDEPAAGRSEGEIIELGRFLLSLRAAGLTILLVEHHMNFVLSIADTVTVLDEGHVVAEGSPSVVRGDARVIAAYLGEEVPA